MDKETIIIASEDVEIIDASEYKEELSEHFGRVPEVAKHLLKGAKTVFSQIEKSLYTAPAFIFHRPDKEISISCLSVYQMMNKKALLR